VKTPVSADIEAGYGDGTEQIVTNVLKQQMLEFME